MNIEIPQHPHDDPGFISGINSLLTRGARKANPKELFAIRVDNWFDHKWLRFSGQGRVKDPWWEGLSLDKTTALDEFSQEHLTFPPFSPSRILAEHHWASERAASDHQHAARRIHADHRQHSAKNLQRRVSQFSRSALFAWFSSKSQPNSQASLMVYSTRGEATLAWYASFRRTDSWRLTKVKGIDQSRVESLLPFDSTLGEDGRS